MCEIKSFVFFDIETTGLPWQERNRTKITELSFVAVSRDNVLSTKLNDSPPLNKLTLVFNPGKSICPEVVRITGLSNDLLRHAPLFAQKIETIVTFLQELPKPVCLVAHNGDRFDYRILLAEFADANASLPNDLLCLDSLTGFKYILSDKNLNVAPNPKVVKPKPIEPKKVELTSDLLTDDEDEWPALNVSTEDWDEIDNLCSSLSDISCEEISEEPVKETHIKKETNKNTSHKRIQIINKVFSKENKLKTNQNGYALAALFKRLLDKEPINWHRAEGDCMMLLQCVVATKDAFIPWADGACKKLVEIQPLVRY